MLEPLLSNICFNAYGIPNPVMIATMIYTPEYQIKNVSRSLRRLALDSNFILKLTSK